MKNLRTFGILLALFIHINSNAQLKVASSGNVNIGGSNSAWTKLQVVGNSTFTNTSGNITSSAYIRGLSNYSTSYTPDYTWFNNDQTGLFHPSKNNIAFSVGGTEMLRINYNVGIGLIDESARLSVYGNATPIALATSVYHTSDNLYATISTVNRTTSKSWAVKYNFVDRFFVSGNGTAYAYSYQNLSDKTLKENIRTVPNALDKVLKLRGVFYNFKNEVLNNSKDTLTVIPDIKPKTELGFIAQEVENVLPEVVNTLDDGRKTVAYSNIVALLVEAIKEQENKIQQLQDEVNSLTELNNSKTKTKESPESNKTYLKDRYESVLYQNNPNPFNTISEISCYIPETVQKAEIFVYDMQGVQLKKIELPSKGLVVLNFKASEFSPGMYLYSLISDGQEVDTKKMIITK